jgi:hypothetical protein
MAEKYKIFLRKTKGKNDLNKSINIAHQNQY